MRVVGRSHEEGSSLPGRRPGNHLRPSKCKAWATLVPVLPTRGLSPLNQQKSTRAQTRNSGKALLGPCCSRGVRGQKQVPLAPPPRGLSCFLIEVRIGACRAAGQRVAWVVCPPFCGADCRGLHGALLSLPALQKWQLGFGSLCVFLSRICPNCT